MGFIRRVATTLRVWEGGTPDPMDLQLLMGIQVELLHTSNYDLRHINHRASFDPGRIITAGVETMLRVWEGGIPDPDGFTIANGITGRITTHTDLRFTTHKSLVELLHTSIYDLRHTRQITGSTSGAVSSAQMWELQTALLLSLAWSYFYDQVRLSCRVHELRVWDTQFPYPYICMRYINITTYTCYRCRQLQSWPYYYGRGLDYIRPCAH